MFASAENQEFNQSENLPVTSEHSEGPEFRVATRETADIAEFLRFLSAGYVSGPFEACRLNLAADAG